MKHDLWVLSPNSRQMQRLTAWAFGLVALPLALFILLAVVWPQAKPSLVQIESVDLHIERLGRARFDQARLESLLRTQPEWGNVQWQAVTLPNSVELGNDVDLPEDAPQSRAWFRFRVPDALMTSDAVFSHGQLALMGNRIMGGPWSVWINGQMVQTNLADWRSQWDVPVRLVLPISNPGTTSPEILIAVPFVDAKGYGIGSLFAGSSDAVDVAWRTRDFWQGGIANITGTIAFALVLFSLQLAWGRRQEPMYALLCANALFWGASGLQYTHDFTGQEYLSLWYGWAVDASINWVVALNFLFAFELVGLAYHRLRAGLVLYAVSSTLLTMPLGQWDSYALVAQHLLNLLVWIGGTLLLTWHAFRTPRKELVLISLGCWIQFVLGAHDVIWLTSQAKPDHVHTFSLGLIVMFLIFMYLTNRRFLQNVQIAEEHQRVLERKLLEQQQLLEAQHAQLRALELNESLRAQHDSIMQDLHDGVGSNLTSALLHARSGKLNATDTVMLLQDLAEELRNLSKARTSEERTLNELLAELRQRVQHRLTQSGIALVWDVDPDLPPLQTEHARASHHLRALLGEAVANVIKHAQASQISLRAVGKDAGVEITVTDNGRGFAPGSTPTGRGLPGMHHRAEQLGAILQIDSQPGLGTVWCLRLG